MDRSRNSKSMACSERPRKGLRGGGRVLALLSAGCCVLVWAGNCVTAAEPNEPQVIDAVSVDDSNSPVLAKTSITPDANDLSVTVTTEEPNVVEVVEPARGPSYIEKTLKDQRSRELWQSSISAPKKSQSDRDSKDLRRLINMVRSIDIRFEGGTIGEANAPEPVGTSDQADNIEPGQPSVPFKLENIKKFQLRDYEPVADKTVQKLQVAMAEPGLVANPFALAEVLFLSGRTREAAAMYSQAFDRTDPNDATAVSERSWIVLQIANCKRRYDRAAALEAYKQVIADYPQSPWVPLAKAHVQLLNWLDIDDPRKLLQDCQVQIAEVRTMTNNNQGYSHSE